MLENTSIQVGKEFDSHPNQCNAELCLLLLLKAKYYNKKKDHISYK